MAPRTVPDAPPWYRDGLRFRCTACGKCCTGGPGYVWVTPDEIERMARFKGQSVARFSREHVRRVGRRLSLIERKNGDCVMLKDGKCSVYAVKPSPCSTFPFWDGALASKDSWKETAERCEGIGQGDLYTHAEIERVRAGDATPLLVKHAAAANATPPPDPAAEDPEGRARTRTDDAAPPPTPPAPPPTGSGSPTRVDAAESERLEAALKDLEALYADLDRELPKYRFTCVASGACCDFEAYGHRLYATTLEAEWFFRHAPAERANASEKHCPAWGPDRLCKARTGRMLGCRTYFCGPYPNGLPEDVHAPFHARLQALHEKHAIPYRYRDITEWAKERRPVPGAESLGH